MSLQLDLFELPFGQFLGRYGFPAAEKDFRVLQSQTRPPTRILESYAGTGSEALSFEPLTNKAVTITAISFVQTSTHTNASQLEFLLDDGTSKILYFTGSVTLDNLLIPNCRQVSILSSVQISVNFFGFAQP